MIKLICASVLIATLTGCSATSALTGLIGSKPEISAQAGAENTKQTLGVNSKVDKSSENKITDSKVKELDSSTEKKVSTSSISADTIKADKIEINSGGNDRVESILIAIIFAMFIAVLCLNYYSKRTSKGA
ncbi:MULTISPECIES: hypothetical protein [Gammaproteobacteria]|uniref:hypothetical protein n=1 Tax=Gammaproteobacteria TaxID=1236 RepID=UPI002FC90784